MPSSFMQPEMPSNYIICGKLDNRSNFGLLSDHGKAKVRLNGNRLARSRKAAPLPVSIVKSTVWYQGEFCDLSTFLAMIFSKGIQCLWVLTENEYLQIVEPASTYGIRIYVFEKRFPIFSGIKYSPSAKINYEILIKHLRKIKQLGISTSSLSNHFSHHHLRMALNKVGFKNNYDRNLLFAYKDGYQEVFKLKEERPDRAVIALDFNSMYLDCMKGDFCNPASIEYKDFQGEAVVLCTLATGFYRVRLRDAKESFLLNYHPFRYKRLGRSYHFELECGDTIETVLHKNEIDYYSPFFENVEVIEGLFSKETIKHPLLSTGLNVYSERMYHRRRGDRVKENFCKASIQHMHSSTNQNRFSKKSFATLEGVRHFLSLNFSMNLDEVSPEELANFLVRHKYFELSITSQGYQLSYLDAGASDTVFSLSAQVVATARLKLLKTLERFMNYRTVELCYANVDSIHISIHRNEINGFLHENHDLISDQLGALKIEAIADKGYWFDIGRYWLTKNEEVVLFKNKGLNHKAATGPFVSRRKISNLIETPEFSHLQTHVMRIDNLFTYHKRLEKITSHEFRFSRFRYEEIKDICNANFTEASEQISSMKEKVALFKRISEGSRDSST